MTDIVEELPPRATGAVGDAAAHLVARGPRHLRVVAHHAQVGYRRSVREVAVL